MLCGAGACCAVDVSPGHISTYAELIHQRRTKPNLKYVLPAATGSHLSYPIILDYYPIHLKVISGSSHSLPHQVTSVNDLAIRLFDCRTAYREETRTTAAKIESGSHLHT